MRRILQLAIAFILPFRNLVAGNRSADAPIAQISVLASGKTLLDGRPATISEVKRALERMKAKSGTVWYYRESGEPPPEAIELQHPRRASLHDRCPSRNFRKL